MIWGSGYEFWLNNLNTRKMPRFNKWHLVDFVARTVMVRNGQVNSSFRVLNRLLGQEGILDEYRRTRRYEKPYQVRQRINYTTCRAIYGEDMQRKIEFVMRKNRIDPYPGYSWFQHRIVVQYWCHRSLLEYNKKN